ncbi:unnamed protein product [Mytilus coruscus]|uniref:Uncharacterized protein n=1 Tax=Mytilus coruscus TaxID=42192 RepID=A0A6J8A8N1_MYTCO|nr:unnamed protein product [Mytilus coruscus]
MNLQSYSKHNRRIFQNEESTTSYTQTISMIAQNRMQHIWITFIDGVKSLYDFAVCLNEPLFEQRRLQELSKHAQEKINLAEQDINSGENEIKVEINRLILLRQNYEQDMEDLNDKIISLSQMATIKAKEVQKATDHVKNAKFQVEIQTNKENQAQKNAVLATSGTILVIGLAVVTGGFAIGAAVVGTVTTVVTHSTVQDAKTALAEKRIELEQWKHHLREIKIKMNRIKIENNEVTIEFNNLDVRHEELLSESKLLTKLKTCISQFHDYINITLRRVDILNERRKVKIFRGNLKQITEKIVEHLLDDQSLEGHFPIMQQLKSLTLEMQSAIMMENLDSRAVVKKLNTGKERKDLLVLKVDSLCTWEQFLMPALTSIAILGQLMAIATKKDFSLDKQIPEGGFKFVKYPGSFRACLVQISNSGCEAFMEAHKSMDKIRMYTMQFQENIRHVVNILINGSEEEKIQVLPGMFEEMKGDADKCLNLAKATEKKFHHVMLLIDETSEASAAVKGVYEDGLKDALEKMKLLQMEEKQIENRKQEMEDEKKRVIEDLERAKSAFDKSLDEVPGVGTLLLMKTVEEGIKIATGAVNIFGQYQMMSISTGLNALTSFCKETIKETLKQSNKSEITTVKYNQHQQELKEAYRHAYKIHVCSEQMYETFKENTDSKGTQEMKVDLGDHENALNGIEDALVKIKNECKRSECAMDPAVIETKATCKKGIELCEEMLKIEKKNMDELFKKVEKLKSETKGFQLKAQVFFKYSPFSIPSTEKVLTDQKSQSKRMIEIASENARYEVELRKKELDDARREREKIQTEVRKMDEEQDRVFEELSKTKIDSINFEEIQKTLKEGLIVLSQPKV